MTYAEKLRDPRWQRKRLEVMSRDEWRCRDCGDGTQNLQVHHHHYAANPWDVDSYFLSTLCDDCHRHRQTLENEAKADLAVILRKSKRLQLEVLARRIADDARGKSYPNWIPEAMWIASANKHPAHRPFVEMVLGRKIEWAEPEKAIA